MDEIWSETTDFKVYTTMASPSPSREWYEKVNLVGRDEYMDFLSTMKFGVGTFEDYKFFGQYQQLMVLVLVFHTYYQTCCVILKWLQ